MASRLSIALPPQLSDLVCVLGNRPHRVARLGAAVAERMISIWPAGDLGRRPLAD